MKVNKKSWHYRALRYNTLGVGGRREYSVSNNLCIYFWQVVGSILFKGVALLVVLPILLSLLVVAPLVSLIAWLKTGIFVQDNFGTVVLLSEVFAISIGLSILSILNLVNKYKNSIDKKPSIIVQYIKAKKNKICPIIKFVGEE